MIWVIRLGPFHCQKLLSAYDKQLNNHWLHVPRHYHQHWPYHQFPQLVVIPKAARNWQESNPPTPTTCANQPIVSKLLWFIGKTIYRTVVAILFLHTAQNTCGPGFDTNHLTPPSAQYHNQYTQQTVMEKPVKSCTSCHHWTMVLIQFLLWNTAWDLLTHQNIETLIVWAWPAHIIGG